MKEEEQEQEEILWIEKKEEGEVEEEEIMWRRKIEEKEGKKKGER